MAGPPIPTAFGRDTVVGFYSVRFRHAVSLDVGIMRIQGEIASKLPVLIRHGFGYPCPYFLFELCIKISRLRPNCPWSGEGITGVFSGRPCRRSHKDSRPYMVTWNYVFNHFLSPLGVPDMPTPMPVRHTLQKFHLL